MATMSEESKVTKQIEPTPTTGNVNVCTNQKAFNQAIKSASEYFSNENKEYMEKHKNKFALCVLLYLVLLVWAVLLAMKVQDKEHRIIHTVIALVCPPTYIIAYYLNNFENGNKNNTPSV